MDKYLAFTERHEGINRKFNVSGYEIDLINYVAKMQFSDQALFVKNLISRYEIASHPTLHSVFKSLLSKNLLLTKPHKLDARKKEVLLTKLGLNYLKQLDQALSKLAKTS